MTGMMRTGNLFVRAVVLPFTVVAVMCGSTLMGSAARAYPVNTLDGWEDGSWQEYAAYLISHQLCASSMNGGDELWPTQVCASVIANLTAKSDAVMPRKPLPRIFGDYDGRGAFVPTGLGLDSGTLSSEVSFDMPRRYNSSSPALVDHAEPIHVDLPAKRESSISLRRNAIPGSLLVTILALVGIVAVARRDVVGQDNARPVAGSGLKVARITSPRHNSDVIAGHIQ